MPILQIPIASAIAWLLAFAFTGAGIFNAMAARLCRHSFCAGVIRRGGTSLPPRSKRLAPRSSFFPKREFGD